MHKELAFRLTSGVSAAVVCQIYYKRIHLFINKMVTGPVLLDNFVYVFTCALPPIFSNLLKRCSCDLQNVIEPEKYKHTFAITERLHLLLLSFCCL